MLFSLTESKKNTNFYTAFFLGVQTMHPIVCTSMRQRPEIGSIFADASVPFAPVLTGNLTIEQLQDMESARQQAAKVAEEVARAVEKAAKTN